MSVARRFVLTDGCWNFVSRFMQIDWNSSGVDKMVGGGAVAELSKVLPRVLIVSRRTVRKNKFVNFVGETGPLHLSAVPFIVKSI